MEGFPQNDIADVLVERIATTGCKAEGRVFYLLVHDAVRDVVQSVNLKKKMELIASPDFSSFLRTFNFSTAFLSSSWVQIFSCCNPLTQCIGISLFYVGDVVGSPFFSVRHASRQRVLECVSCKACFP